MVCDHPSSLGTFRTCWSLLVEKVGQCPKSTQFCLKSLFWPFKADYFGKNSFFNILNLGLTPSKKILLLLPFINDKINVCWRKWARLQFLSIMKWCTVPRCKQMENLGFIFLTLLFVHHTFQGFCNICTGWTQNKGYIHQGRCPLVEFLILIYP